MNFFAICIDRESGRVRHDIKLGTQHDPQYCHPFNSYASPTPFIEAGRLYAHFGSLGTWCVNTATGKVIWDARDLKCDHFRGAASSPVVYGDLLYQDLDGADFQYVIALNKATGETAWKTDRNIKYSTDNGDYKKAYANARFLRSMAASTSSVPPRNARSLTIRRPGRSSGVIAHGGMNGARGR